MEPEYKLKFKLYWEVRNPKTVEVVCTVCNGAGLYEESSCSMGPNFEDCPYCMKTGKMVKVDPDQYPKIDPELEREIQSLIDDWKSDTCVWRKQKVLESNGEYFTEYECCRHSRGRHKTVKAVVPDKCPFCYKCIVLENC